MELLTAFLFLALGYIMGLIHRGVNITVNHGDNSPIDQEELDRLNNEIARLHPNQVQEYVNNRKDGDGTW